MDLNQLLAESKRNKDFVSLNAAIVKAKSTAIKFVRENLEQSSIIADKTIEDWAQNTFSILYKETGNIHLSEQALIWHLNRLRGIGGSDIGVIVTEGKGGRDEFTTAREIALQKLMRLPPSGATVQMSIGTFLEGTARERFERSELFSYGKLKRVVETEDNIDKPSWLIGNPDDYFQGEYKGVKFNLLVDYKVTISDAMSEEYSDEQVPERYKYQLHHYAMKIKTGDNLLMALTPMFKGEDGGFVQNVIPVPYESKREKEILHYGNAFWDNLKNGIVPEKKFTKITKDISDQIFGDYSEDMARFLVFFNKMQAKSKEKEDELKNLIKNYVSKVNIEPGKTRVGTSLVSIKEVIKETLFKDTFPNYEEAYVPSGKLDEKKAIDILVDNNLFASAQLKEIDVSKAKEMIIAKLGEDAVKDYFFSQVERITHDRAGRNEEVAKAVLFCENVINDSILALQEEEEEVMKVSSEYKHN